MYEYEIMNISTEERELIYGYTESDAFRRRDDLNRADWKVIFHEYID